jgi:hypothetical protein
MRDFYVVKYKSQDYISDFAQTFRTSDDKRDYRKLREYINKKEEVLRVLRMAGDELYYGLSYTSQFGIDYMQSLEDDLKGRKPDESIQLRLNSVRPIFNFNGNFTVKHIKDEILPRIRTRFRETDARDSLNGIFYAQLQRNINILSQDIFHAEQAIHAALAPELRDQEFKVWISLTFSGLIGTLLLSFFVIILMRSDATLARHLLSSAGLQFITVFILIIAIVLFGILGVLGGSELAAILSGISGYILGKGSGGFTDKSEEHSEVHIAAAPEPVIQKTKAIQNYPKALKQSEIFAESMDGTGEMEDGADSLEHGKCKGEAGLIQNKNAEIKT